MTRTTRLAAIAVAAAAVVVLSGCQADETGAAAIVGDTRISESQVSESANAAVAAVEKMPAGTAQPIDQTVLLRQTTSRMVAHQLLEIAAAEEGVTVTQTDVDKLLDSVRSGQPSQEAFEADIAAQTGVPPSEIESFARDYLIRQNLGEKLAPTGDLNAQSQAAATKLAQVAEEVGVTISPRYGTWDPTTSSVTTAGTDTLSRPASPSPSASPAG